MEENKSGRYPWGSDKNVEKTKEEIEEVNERFNQLVSDVKDIGERLNTTASWNSLSDTDLIKLGALSTYIFCAARAEYEDRYGLEQIEEDVFGSLTDEEIEKTGVLD